MIRRLAGKVMRHLFPNYEEKATMLMVAIQLVPQFVFEGYTSTARFCTIAVLSWIFGVLSLWLYVKWRSRQTIHGLRGLAPDALAKILSDIPSRQDRATIKSALARHGAVDDGNPERFSHSPVDRAELKVGFATLTSAAVICAIVALRANSWQLALSALVVVLTVSAFCVRRVGIAMSATLEVTPFGLAQIRSDGSREHLTWGTPMVLTARRWPKRLYIVSADGRSITVLASIVAFERLAQLIIERGGFTHEGQT